MMNALGIWGPRTLIFVAVAAALLNASWAQGALVVALRGQSCADELLSAARERVAGLFGSVQSAPLIGCLPEPALGVAVTYGQTRFAPLLPAVVLLGPKGQNLDVAAHEWAHAELSKRLGVLTRSWRVPVWFDEGLAMQVDERPEYQLDQLAAVPGAQPQLEGLATSKQFFSDRAELGRLRYGFARCVVQRWHSVTLQGSDRTPAALLDQWLSKQSLWRVFSTADFYPFESHCTISSDSP